MGRGCGVPPHEASRPQSKCRLLSRSLEKHPSGKALRRAGGEEASGQVGSRARASRGKPESSPGPTPKCRPIWPPTAPPTLAHRRDHGGNEEDRRPPPWEVPGPSRVFAVVLTALSRWSSRGIRFPHLKCSSQRLRCVHKHRQASPQSILEHFLRLKEKSESSGCLPPPPP